MDLQINILNLLTRFLDIFDPSKFAHFLDQSINISIKSSPVNIPRKGEWRSRKRVRRSRKCIRVSRTVVWKSMNVSLVTGNDSSAMVMYQ